MSELEVRHSNAGDVEQIRRIFGEPSTYAATLQLPFPSAELWEKRLAALPEGSFSLVACRGAEVLGQLGLDLRKNPRRRHAYGRFGFVVEGTMRQYAFRDGEWVDVHVMSRIAAVAAGR